MSTTFRLLALGLACAIATGCQTITTYVVPDAIKSQAQLNMERAATACDDTQKVWNKAKKGLTDAEKQGGFVLTSVGYTVTTNDQTILTKKVPVVSHKKTVTTNDETVVTSETTTQSNLIVVVTNPVTVVTNAILTPPMVNYRIKFLNERRAYMNVLVAEFDRREALLERKACNAGYLALGTKATGIGAGIASAILVAASPANAATVAGLGAVGAGSAALQDTAVGIGYSTTVAQAELEAFKTSVGSAYNDLGNAPWEYLYAFSEHANQTDWDAQMKILGAAIVRVESAVRFTKYEVQIRLVPQEKKPEVAEEQKPTTTEKKATTPAN